MTLPFWIPVAKQEKPPMASNNSTKKAPDPAQMVTSLTDGSLPLDHRMHMLAHLCMDPNPHNMAAIDRLFALAAKNNGEAIYEKKIQELATMIEELFNGPLRSGMFLQMVAPEANGKVPRARVVLEDGGSVYPVIPEQKLVESLRRGELVLMDGQAKAILGRDPGQITIGEEARFERRLDDERVEVVLRDHEPYVFMLSADLADELASTEIPPGSKFLVDTRRRIAVDYIPAADGLSHYWYLVREPVPDVVVGRDIGCPPAYIDEMVDHIRMFMLHPEISLGYKIRAAQTKLLQGVSGSGKTLSIYGFWRRMYEVMSEVTGLAIDELPPRVLRLRTSDVYIKWFGDSEKRLARFFNEVEQIADQPVVAADGTEYRAPVLAICEEFDALGRARGTGEPIGERIQATALERLDVNSPRMKDRLVIVLATTNVPHLVDPALVRRVGGTTETFGRLGRRGFQAVLEKQIRGLRFRADHGRQQQAERRVLHEVTDWLFSQNGHDAGQVEINYVGSTEPDRKYRRDLMTGALVDRGVQEAAREACRAEYHGCDDPGLTTRMIIDSLQRQIRNVVDQLTPFNVHNYVTIPDGARVGTVRRLDQPSVSPFELERDE
jgi:ATP-dependent 26S proteasome regulatory subunit